MIACSIWTGHGTAIKKKTIGNKKCRSQGQPPIWKVKASDTITPTKAITQLNSLQSGFASARNRRGKIRSAPETSTAGPKLVPDGWGAGRSIHRFHTRYRVRNGTVQAWGYCGLWGH